MTAALARLWRLRLDPVVWGVAAGYLVVGFTLGALGPVLARLRAELHLGGTVAALHGAAYGLALVGVALLGDRVQVRAGRRRVLVGGTVLLGAGLVGMGAAPAAALSLPAAVAVGVGAALVVLVLPGTLKEHPGCGPETFTDVNAMASVASIVAPAALAVVLSVGLGWRAPFVLLAVAATAAALAAARPLGPGHVARVDASPWPLLRRRRFVLAWVVLMLGISVEFGTVTWAASFSREVGHDPEGVAAVLGALFGIGALAGRLASAGMLARWPAATVRPASFLGVAAGSTLLFLGPGPAARLAGVALAGVGASLLYPLGMERLFTLAPGSAAGVSAAGALAGGISITLGPLAVGALADLAGLGRAVLVLPILAAVGVAMELSLRQDEPRAPEAVPA